ncbi:DUF3527 domain-containing protein [Quillaja saponaria]|uniref:DUF3527 domain-containing protein n=1 Tax=Quillaja saponaria TaxID=32244 RepID=A0AAD7L7J6_QUISA|nr:DUF3527 domain-containing protein [Quillaja saponaria]
MGQEIELDPKKRPPVGLSPNTVLPSYQCRPSVEKRHTKGKSTRKDDILFLKEDFREFKFGGYRSSSCKSTLSRPVSLEDNIQIKRGSIYQGSKEVRHIKQMSTTDGRRKIEMSHSSDTASSFSLFDSWCSSDNEAPHQRSPVISQKSYLSPVPEPHMESYSSDGFIEICLNSDDKHSTNIVGKDSVNLKFRNDKLIGVKDLKRNTTHTLNKSLSAKVEMSHSLSPAESDVFSRASSKVRFSPIRKIFDPFMKSKSLRSPLGYVAEAGEAKTTGRTNIRRNRSSQKSLLNDFSNTEQSSEFVSKLVKNETHHSVTACSPVHLHANLKLENKQGVPFFEFKLNCPEDVFVAKTWKSDNAYNWVYTFHSIDKRKKSNASGWGSNDGNKDCLMMGQMQVSCYLCSELKDGVLDNSMQSEFVLYDIAHARQSVPLEKISNSDPDAENSVKALNLSSVRETSKQDEGAHPVKHKLHQRNASENGDFDCSNSYPWVPAELHPSLEIAAIVMQAPFHKRESLKYKRTDKVSGKIYPDRLDLFTVEQSKKSPPDRRSHERLKVVIPTGNHGLPNAENLGPSSLLDRWRLGGGCECGGWDMACPLILLDNPGIQLAEDQPLMGTHLPLELFFQGAKESMPALVMTVVEEGKYAVDFHAQLSTLQAFSICVAILHGMEAVTDAGKEKNSQSSQCNSLKLLIEEEVNFLIEAVTSEEKTNKAPKMLKGTPPSYVLNPPFSPIARV